MEGAKRKKGEQSENQEGDVPRNYIRLGSGDAVEWKAKRTEARVFAEFKRVAGIDNCELQRLEKVDEGKTKFH